MWDIYTVMVQGIHCNHKYNHSKIFTVYYIGMLTLIDKDKLWPLMTKTEAIHEWNRRVGALVTVGGIILLHGTYTVTCLVWSSPLLNASVDPSPGFKECDCKGHF